LLARVRTHPNVGIVPFSFFRDLVIDPGDGGRVIGIQFEDEGLRTNCFAKATLLATGGGSQVYSQSTNPETATGDGLAAAYRAGAVLRDMEFVQFHPTALNLPGVPRFLLTEALRGDGGHIVNEHGDRFVDELLTRDEVSRAVFRQLTARPGAKVFLDVTHIASEMLRNKFRHVYTTCLQYGLDITRAGIPITPAAHYFMGGIETDLGGRTSLRGLYAAGEVASCGVHGANRLASNSLLEGLVFGGRTATAMREDKASTPSISSTPGDNAPKTVAKELVEKIREITWRHAGIARDAAGLKTGLRLLSEVPEDPGTRNLLTVARIIHECALAREESRGAHYREDFSSTAATAVHSRMSKRV
jgi:L-aspartate oxidase